MDSDINILLVDDEPSLLDQAKTFLEKEDERLNLITASSAEEGLDLLDDEDIDVIISDYKMPETDGLEFLETVRKDLKSEIPFIVFTGKGREEVAIEALNLGADRYLQKGGSPGSQYGVLADAVIQEYEHHLSSIEVKEKEKRLNFLELAINEMKDFKIAVVGEDYRYKTVNDWYVDEYDYDSDEIVGMTVEKLMGEENFRETVKPHLDKALDGEVSEYSSWFDFPSGKKFMEVIYYPLEESKSVAIVIHDITDRKEFEEELKEKKTYLERVPEFIVALDEEGAIEYWSSSSSPLDFELLDPEKIEDESVFDFVHPEDREETINIFEMAVENPGEEFSAEIRGKAEEGWIWFEARAISLLDDPDVESIIVTGRVIEERKEKEKKLEESRRMLEKALQEAPYPMALYAEDGEVIDINQAWKDITGYSLEDVPTLSDWAEKAYGEKKEEIMEILDGLHKEGKTPEGVSKIETKDGEQRMWEFKSSEIGRLSDDRNMILSIAKDITEQKEMEEELKRKEKYIDHTPEYITVLDEEGNIKYHSYPSDEISVLDASEFMGESFENAHPDDREKALEMFSEIFENPGEEYRMELRGRGKEDWIWFEIRAVNHLDDPEVEGIIITAQDISKKKENEKEIEENRDKIERLHEISAEIQLCDSEEEVYSLAIKAAEGILDFDICSFDAVEGDMFVIREISTATPEDGHADRPIDEGGLASKTYLNKESYVVDDVSADKDAKPVKSDYRSAISVPIGDQGVFQAVSTEVGHFDEEDLKTAELLISHVSQAIERIQAKKREEYLHSLLRHDMSNNLQLLDGYLYLLREIDLPEEAEGLVEKGNLVLEKTKGLIEKIRNLRELDEEEIKDVEIGSIIESAISKNKDRLEDEGIELEFEEFEEKVRAGSLLEEVFSNLMENSIRHANCDRIKLSGRVEGDELVVILEDDGKGISEDVKDKIFDRGFKKGEKSGSGLGTFLVKEIVESYGGSVEAKDSELGGARFDIYLERVPQ